MKYVILILTVLIFNISCDNKDDINGFITEEINQYNKRIDKWRGNSEEFLNDPILITTELFSSDNSAKKIIINYERPSVNQAIVILTMEGLSDDSVDGEKRIINFEKINGNWIIKSIQLGFKCWESRGHTNYSGELCS